MTAKPRKPLMVNLTWAGAAMVGIAVLYVASFCGMAVLMGRDVIPLKTGHDLQLTIYRPIIWYAENDLPGGAPLMRLAAECYSANGGGTEGHERWGE